MDIGGFTLWRKKASSRQNRHVVQSWTFIMRTPKFRTLERVVLAWVAEVKVRPKYIHHRGRYLSVLVSST